MTSKAVKRNINSLESKLERNKGNLSTQQKAKVRDIIGLYTDRKISQYTTAERIVNDFIKAKSEDEKSKANQKYDQVMNTYEEREPLSERMKKNKQENITRGHKTKPRDYTIGFRFFTMSGYGAYNVKASFKDIQGGTYYPMHFDDKHAGVKTGRWIEELVKKRIFRLYDKNLFKKVIKTLAQDDDIARHYKTMKHYIDAVVIYDADTVEGDIKDYDPKKKNLKNANNIGIFHRYMETELEPEYCTFEEAIKVKHYVENECWINTLNDFYGQDKNMKKMTRESILKLIDKTDEEFKNHGASIEDMHKVFKEYAITARIFDIVGNLSFTFDPPKRNHHIKTFYALIKNDHIYTLNKDLKQLKSNLGIKKEYNINVNASTDFYLNHREEPIKCIMIEELDDILKHTEQDEYTMIYTHNDLAKMYYQAKQAGYDPKIKFSACIISELMFQFRIKKRIITYRIKTQNLINAFNASITVETEDTYNRMSRAMFEFNKSLFNPLHKSYYNDIDVEILNRCRTVAPAGKFHYFYHSNELHIEIDQNKAYTHNLTNIVKIPVFKQFDIWMPYEYGKHDFNNMGELCLFLVKFTGKQTSLFFNKQYNLIYGMFLEEFIDEVEILYFKKPSSIYEVDYKSIVENLWKTNISNNLGEDIKVKKLISNVNIGLLEKGTNKSQKSLVFDTLSEALYHQNLYGGRINKISGFYDDKVLTEMTDEYIKELEQERGEGWVLEFKAHDNDDDRYRNSDDGTYKFWKNNMYYHNHCRECYKIIDGKKYDIKHVEKESEVKYYTLTTTHKQDLTNGFRYIKELLMQRHNFKMHKDYKTLKNNNINVHSVKTDAFIIDRKNIDKAKTLIKFSTKRGGWRAEDNKQVSPPSDIYKIKVNELSEIPTYNNVKIRVKDEYDTKSICEQIVSCNPVLIKAKLAGSGKSYIGEYMKNLGYNVLFVCSNNKQKQETEADAVTLNKFFSIPIEAGERLPTFDHSDYNCIVFDELGMAGNYILNRVREFKDTYPEKIIIGTADGKQLKPIADLTNSQDHETYLNNCLNQIFKYKIYLKISKRLKTEEDKIKLNDIYNDIWKNKLPIKEIVNKHFETTSDIMEGEHNIAYTNARCKWVSKTVRNNLGKTDKYEIGEHVICRVYKKEMGQVFNVNITYEIISIDDWKVEIQDIKSKTIFMTNTTTLDKHFIHAYCATCHSSQGASLDKSITIHEWDKSHLVSREWIWTALTRCRDINKVKFFKADVDDTDLNEAQVTRYLEHKIKQYKLQDMKAEREIDNKQYIDVKWLFDRLNTRCNKCSSDFDIEINNGVINSNMTAQRINNDYAHHKENCISYCLNCNRREK